MNGEWGLAARVQGESVGVWECGCVWVAPGNLCRESFVGSWKLETWKLGMVEWWNGGKWNAGMVE